MFCYDCDFHASGHLWNCCHLTCCEYYNEYYETSCPIIDDNYIVIADIPELGLKKGEKVEVE